MGLRQYVNNFQKELQIGSNAKGVKFRGGFYETEDPERQALIESNASFGIAIHFKDSIEEMERIGREREEKGAAEKVATRKKVLAEVLAEEEAEILRLEKDNADKDLLKEQRERVAASKKRLEGDGESEKAEKSKKGK